MLKGILPQRHKGINKGHKEELLCGLCKNFVHLVVKFYNGVVGIINVLSNSQLSHPSLHLLANPACRITQAPHCQS